MVRKDPIFEARTNVKVGGAPLFPLSAATFQRLPVYERTLGLNYHQLTNVIIVLHLATL